MNDQTFNAKTTIVAPGKIHGKVEITRIAIKYLHNANIKYPKKGAGFEIARECTFFA